MDPEQQNEAVDSAPEAPEQVQQPEAASTEPSPSMLDALRGSLGQPSDEDGTEAPQGADERLRGPDGRFLAKEPEAQPEAKPGEPQPKPEDDPYREPEGLKPEAKERFQSLVARAKEATAAAEQATAQVEQMRGTVESFQRMIAETGADDRELLALFDFARAIKSGNWQQVEPMLAHLTQQYRVATGRDPSGSDPFAQHADLAQAVTEGKITPEYARQVLQSRQVLARQEQQAQAHQAQQHTQQQFVQSAERATQAVRTLVAQWSQTDLDWPKKAAVIQQHARRIGETMPPEHWQAALQMAYDAIGQTMTAMAPQRQPPAPSAPQPLRPSAANAGRREPASMLEAVSSALGAPA